MAEREVELDAKREPGWRVVVSVLVGAGGKTRILYAFLAAAGLVYFLFAYSNVDRSVPTPQPVAAALATTHNDRLGQVEVVGTPNDDEGNPMARPPSRIGDGSPELNGGDYRLERDSCCPGE